MGKSEILRSRFGGRVTARLSEMRMSTIDLSIRTALPIDRIERVLSGTLITIALDDMSTIADALGTPLFHFLAPIEPALPVVAIKEVEQRRTRHA